MLPPVAIDDLQIKHLFDTFALLRIDRRHLVFIRNGKRADDLFFQLFKIIDLLKFTVFEHLARFLSDFGDNREFIDLFDICAVENFKLFKHARDILLAVLDDFIFQIVVGIQKLVAIFIDRLALLVCDVVVF